MSLVSCEYSGRGRQRSARLSPCRLPSDFNGKEGKEEVESLPWHLLIRFFSCFPGRQEARLQGWEEEVRLCKLALLRLSSCDI